MKVVVEKRLLRVSDSFHTVYYTVKSSLEYFGVDVPGSNLVYFVFHSSISNPYRTILKVDKKRVLQHLSCKAVRISITLLSVLDMGTCVSAFEMDLSSDIIGFLKGKLLKMLKASSLIYHFI